jgi:NAD(P)-dependent dehydrogenase (short-subunit alcohol dehydrogenase family)
MTLQGQVALVAGAGRGLGRATALSLARDGANVVLADILADDLAQTEREVTAAGARTAAVTCDLSDEAQVAALVARTTAEFGQLDILVNTVAWIDPPALVVDMPLEVWEKTLRYDLTTHFLCCKHALKVMIPRGYGRIVNTSSEAGTGGYRLRGAYGAAKAAVINLSMTLAAETSQYDIKVNVICPRAIEGVRHDRISEMFAEYIERSGSIGPAPSQGKPPMAAEDVAAVILFLVSKEASQITGQAIRIG